MTKHHEQVAPEAGTLRCATDVQQWWKKCNARAKDCKMLEVDSAKAMSTICISSITQTSCILWAVPEAKGPKDFKKNQKTHLHLVNLCLPSHLVLSILHPLSCLFVLWPSLFVVALASFPGLWCQSSSLACVSICFIMFLYDSICFYILAQVSRHWILLSISLRVTQTSVL